MFIPEMFFQAIIIFAYKAFSLQQELGISEIHKGGFWSHLQLWNSTFLIIEGTTKMVLQFIMPPKSIYKQNLGFVEQKMYF